MVFARILTLYESVQDFNMLFTMNECSCSLDFVMAEEWVAVFLKRNGTLETKFTSDDELCCRTAL